MLILFWLVPFIAVLASSYLTVKHFRTRSQSQVYPPITILKPLKGVDSGLYENLKSFFELDYPNYELILSVAEESDPALLMAQELIQKYPKHSARVIIGEKVVGINPKVNNLMRAYEQAQNEWILISDSNVRAPKSMLKDLAQQITPKTGMITSVISGIEPSSWASRLEAASLNTYYARGMILTAKLGHPCVVGKSMLFQKSTANRFGGIQNLSRYLAEDYMAGIAMKKLGLEVIISTTPVFQFLGKYTFKEYWNRHVRWGRIRKAQAPVAFLLEPLYTSFLSGVLGAWIFSGWVSPLWFLCFHLLICGVSDFFVARSLQAKPGLVFGFFWLMREVLAPLIWMHTMISNQVYWRGAYYTIQSGGLLTLDNRQTIQ